MKIVVAHQNADLDALACLVAASRLYDGVVAVGGTSISPSVQRFLALHKDRFPLLAPGDVDPDAVEQLVVVDVRDRRRLRAIDAVLDRRPPTIVWDHHPPGAWDIDADEVHVEPMGACVTLLVEQLIAAGRDIPPEDATLYLLGLYADTGRLSYGTTRARDIRVAAHLLERGARLKVVNRYLRDSLTPDQNRLLVALIAGAREVSIDRVEINLAAASMPDVVRGASTVVQQVMELGGNDAMFAAIYFEKNRRVQLIGRSRVSYVDVGAILGEFGGGGHRGAGAATLKDGELDDVVARLEEVLCAAPLNPARVREIMTHDVEFIAHDTSLAEASARLTQLDITGAPVRRDGAVVGIISRRDIRRAETAGKLDLPVSSHMANEVATIEADEPIEDALDLMTARDIGRIPVTENGAIVGIVTRTDIINLLYVKVRDDSDLLLEL